MLAIGLVVDDAIVVVGGGGTSHREGSYAEGCRLKAMEEVSGPVVAIALILSAVFVPTVFIPGITGRLYQQFAVTIAVSVIFSAFNALTLSPALAALLLRPKTEARGPLGAFFRWFNRIFGQATDGYVGLCATLIHKMGFTVLLLVGFAALAGLFGKKVPAGFLPDEDQGYVFAVVQLPDAASLQRTAAGWTTSSGHSSDSRRRVHPSVVGYSMLSGAAPPIVAFSSSPLNLQNKVRTRQRRGRNIKAILASINTKIRALPDCEGFCFPPPPIPGIGTSGGATFILQDLTGGKVDLFPRGQHEEILHRGRGEAPGNSERLQTTFNAYVPQRFRQCLRPRSAP